MGRISVRLALFIAAVLVIYSAGLSHTPPHLHHDEVVISIQSHSLATTGRDFEGRLLPLYFHTPHVEQQAWYQPAIVYFTAPFLWVLPSAEWSFRFPTAVVATIDVLLMFFLARRLLGADRWGWVAAILLAATPAHYVLGRVVFDFIYPLPFVLGWLLAVVSYLEDRRPWQLFVAGTVLGVGFYSYIASMAMMPIYLALTFFLLMAHRQLTVRTGAIALAGFAWPLLLLVPWIAREPGFVMDVLNRYSIGTTTATGAAQLQTSLGGTIANVASGFRPSAIAERITLYWTFFDPAYLFLIGGYTHLTASTRLVGVFLLPFALLIPLGLIQMVTRARTAVSVVIVTGLMLSPLAAVLTVKEPYSASRQLPVVVFGAIIATYGVQRIMTWSGVGRAIAIGVLALLPLHYLFFMSHYFVEYHKYAAAPFEWNHRDALAAIIERSPAGNPKPVFLTTVREQHIDAFWRLALAIHHREDLMAHTTYIFPAKMDGFASIPAGALVLATLDDKSLLDAVKTGEFTEIMRAQEPADEPVLYVLQRNP
jgi:4-amino-4-deoxy-L-arabinose transferase-like glycosyltransferase